MHITDDGTTASATADYRPAFPCTATWTQTARVGDVVTMLETVSDATACAQGSMTTLTPSGATLLWTYASNPAVTATLIRTS